MQAKEKVRRAIEHREVFPLPYRLKFVPVIGRKLQEVTGLPDFDRSIGNALAHLKMTLQPPPPHISHPIGQVDEFGCVWLTDEYTGSNVVEHPLADGGIDTFPFPDPHWPPRFETMARQASAEQDRFTLFSFDWTLFERAHFMRGMEQFLIDMLLKPSLAEALLDRILAFNLAVIEQACQLPIDGVILSDDYGMQKGLIMNPKHWRRFLKPRLRQEFELIKRYGKTVCLHSDGDVSAIVPDLIEIGLDVLNPVQPEALDLPWLKREYGKNLCFYGGISTQRTLPFGTPEDVKAEVGERIEIMGQEGGYIIAPGIVVLADTPMENVLAFVEAVQQQETL